MNTGIALALLSGLIHIVAYLDYNRVVFAGKTKPNGATWAIWSVIALVSTSSYFAASGDFWKNIIPLTNVLLCIGTFVLALIGRKFVKLGASDWCAFGIGIVAIFVWKQTSATCANLVVQIAIMIGFIPTFRMVWETPSHETARPWLIWASGYVAATTVIILRWKHQWADLAYPLNCIVLHTLVPLIGAASRRWKTRLLERRARERP